MCVCVSLYIQSILHVFMCVCVCVCVFVDLYIQSIIYVCVCVCVCAWIYIFRVYCMCVCRSIYSEYTVFAATSIRLGKASLLPLLSTVMQFFRHPINTSRNAWRHRHQRALFGAMFVSRDLPLNLPMHYWRTAGIELLADVTSQEIPARDV